jgi:hypothetical protein
MGCWGRKEHDNKGEAVQPITLPGTQRDADNLLKSSAVLARWMLMGRRTMSIRLPLCGMEGTTAAT